MSFYKSRKSLEAGIWLSERSSSRKAVEWQGVGEGLEAEDTAKEGQSPGLSGLQVSLKTLNLRVLPELIFVSWISPLVRQAFQNAPSPGSGSRSGSVHIFLVAAAGVGVLKSSPGAGGDPGH